MKKIIAILLILVFSVTVLLSSCGDNPPVETNTETNTETGSQATDTSKDTSSDTNKDSGSSGNNNNKPSKPSTGDTNYDTPIEHNLKVDNSVKLDIFDSENTYGNEGNTVDYTNATSVDVSQLANNKVNASSASF